MNSKLKIYAFFIVLSVLFISNIGIISADYVITEIDIDDNFMNGVSVQNLSGTLESETSDNVVLHIESNTDSTGLDFNANVSGTDFDASFYVTSEESQTQSGWPAIQASECDEVVVSADLNEDVNDLIIVDAVVPSLDTASIDSIDVEGGHHYNNGDTDFYSSDFNVNYTYGADACSYLAGSVILLASPSDFNEWNIENFISYESDTNTQEKKNIDPIADSIDDGNYYVMITSGDAAKNVNVNEVDIKSTNQLMYIDNSVPEYDICDLGYEDENVFYVDENTFDLNIEVMDISAINDAGAISKLEVINPSGVPQPDQTYDSDTNLFTYEPESTYSNNDIFQFSLNAEDNVANLLIYDFNIFFDLNAPSTPLEATTFLDIDADKNITIAWLASVDDESGVNYYEVYRSGSDFNSVSGATKIHTTSDSSTLSYEDTSDKDQGERYYYGVRAIDFAGNASSLLVDYIDSGPEVDLEIEDGDEYTNKSQPNMLIEVSSDVNEVRFSCDDSSWSSWISIDDDEEDYDGFNITSGNGCNSDNEEKTIYVQARSEDDYPNKTSKASDEIKYDSHAPDVPSNLDVQENTDGSLTVSWDECEDNNSNDVEYVVYYSKEDDVAVDSNYASTATESYNLSPNEDQTYYFKVSSLDESGNESSLSSGVSGEAERFGPTFDLTITPSNIYDEVWYVGYGEKQIKAESDEELKYTPTIKLSLDSSSYENLEVSYNGEYVTTTDYNFTESGNASIEVRGANNNDEYATDDFSFVVDANIPTFDLNYNIVDINYDFYLTNDSNDIYKVQYLLDNQNEICIKQIDENTEEKDFNCTFDTTTVEDGEYEVYVLAYDYALNLKKEILDVSIDNVNETEMQAIELKSEVEELITNITNRLNKLDQLLIEVDGNLSTELDLVNEEKVLADQKYDQNNYFEAKNKYSQISNSLLEIQEKLPTESTVKNKQVSIVYDSNYSIDPTSIVSDTNSAKDTELLYEDGSISCDRNFMVQEINSKKYFSVLLKVKNNSNEDQTLTIVEEIPKGITNSVEDLVFNKEVEVLVKDPIIKYTLTIPANSSDTLRYNRLTPITDVDVVTKFNSIKFKDPMILNGAVDASNILYDKPINYKLLIIICSILLFLVIIMIILGFIIKKKKMKEEKLADVGTKEVMNKYLGEKKGENIKENMSLEKKTDKSKSTKDTKKNRKERKKDKKKKKEDDDKKFKEDYAFIMNAMKKRE